MTPLATPKTLTPKVQRQSFGVVLDALRSTGGTAIAVDDEALLADASELGRLTGINACPEGGACITALRELVRRGAVGPDDEVVVFNTGAGTKYVETLPALPDETLPAPPR